MTHQPYPAPPRRRANPAAVVLLVVGGFIVLVVVAVVVLMAVSGGSDGTLPAANKPAANASTHPVGSTATDAKFTFRVTAAGTSQRLKGEGGTSLAQGRFVRVWVAVTNNSPKARFISADDQQLHAGGKTYGVDVEATVNVDKGPEIGLPERINGGATETIIIVFDAPDAAKPTAIEVHGSTDSAGALLALPVG